jgi:YfiH family protein
MKKTTFDYLIPEWPAPDNVQAIITLRSRGGSGNPFEYFNLATHVGDEASQVEANRMLLVQQLGLESQPLWLNQVHGTEIMDSALSDCLADADGCFSDGANRPCVIMTADCLPVLLCNQQGTKVAAVHAGWRGLCSGIIHNALKKFDVNDVVLAYLGPAISAEHFEVGSEVLDHFLANAIGDEHRSKIDKAFVRSGSNHYFADLYALARAELEQNSVYKIFGGDFCSYGQPEQFYSYRRDKHCGRNASLIWLKS